MTRARVCPQKPAARPVAALIIAAAVALLAGSAPAAAQPALPLVDGLRVTTVAAAPRGSTVRVMQPFGRKGPTSIRFFPESTRRRARPSPNPSDPPGSSYLIKDRDLGQTLFSNLALALSQDDAWSSFPSSFEQRLRQQPGTWGRPDVDTYRDLVLWIEGTDISATTAGRPGVTLSVVDGPPSGPRVAASYDGADSSGNTSVAHDRADTFKWSGTSPFAHGDWGHFTPEGIEVPYIKRDRDLGQTFTYAGDRPARLDAITLRTGFGSGVVRPGAYGRAVSVQIFEVTGRPALDDNGTTGATSALHGFPHDRRGQGIPAERDDYLTGEAYRPLALVTGGRFPSKADFGLAPDANVDPGHPRLKGRYLRWDLEGDAEVMLEPGRTYAFLVMLDEAHDNSGFTLANHYVGNYPGGHGIRRDGNGVFPPAPADPARASTDAANAAARAAARFPADMAARAAIPPGTNGYPDVDTWRDLAFWVEVSVPDRDR